MRMQQLWRSRLGRLGLIVASALLGLLALTQGALAQVALPPAVSDQGDDIRVLFFVVLGIGVAVFVIVEAMILWVVFRYRRKSDDELPTQIAHNNTAEVLWTVIPLVIVVALFIGSLVVLEDVQSAADPDEEVVEIDVQGRQWAWAFNYAVPLGTALADGLSEDPAETEILLRDPSMVQPFMTLKLGVEHMRVTAREGDVVTVERAVNGTVPIRHQRGADVMRVFNGTDTVPEGRLQAADNTPIVTVPVGTMIRFNIASADVLHAFYTPQFLYKLDAVPGRVQTMWVRVNETGEFQSQCAEFCGRDHARMIFSVVALSQRDYRDWFAAKTPELGEPVGGRLRSRRGSPGGRGRRGQRGQRPAAVLLARLQCLSRRPRRGSGGPDDRPDDRPAGAGRGAVPPAVRGDERLPAGGCQRRGDCGHLRLAADGGASARRAGDTVQAGPRQSRPAASPPPRN